MADTSIERLYEVMAQISENKKNGKTDENAPLFGELLHGVKGESRSKRLASQFVARLFRDFPAQLQAQAYEAMVDLADDEDAAVRKQAISDLPKLCKDAASYAPRVADLLVQLMQSDDSQEQSLVNQALMQTLTAHPTEALTGLFDQLGHDEAADVTRERALRFLAAKLPHLALSPEQEELLAQLAERLLEDVSEEEFGAVLQLLAGLGCMRGQAGRQRLVDTVCQQADLAAGFQPACGAAVARARECARQAGAFMGQRSVNAKALLLYFLDQVLPVIDQVPDSSAAGESPRLELLRCLAELACHPGSSFVATDKQLNLLLARLKDAMPLPPTPPTSPTLPPPTDEAAAAAAAKPEEGEIEATPTAPEAAELNFSLVECLLFAFHELARSNPDFLTACPERLADFTKRMKYFSQANQIYLHALRSSARARRDDSTSTAKKPPTPSAEAAGEANDESEKAAAATAATAAAAAAAASPELRSAALAVTENIARLARDLLRRPAPVYRAEVAGALSWHPPHLQQPPQPLMLRAVDGLDRKRRIDGSSNNNGGGGGFESSSSRRRTDRDRRYGGGGGGSWNRRGWRGGGGGSRW